MKSDSFTWICEQILLIVSLYSVQQQQLHLVQCTRSNNLQWAIIRVRNCTFFFVLQIIKFIFDSPSICTCNNIYYSLFHTAHSNFHLAKNFYAALVSSIYVHDDVSINNIYNGGKMAVFLNAYKNPNFLCRLLRNGSFTALFSAFGYEIVSRKVHHELNF